MAPKQRKSPSANRSKSPKKDKNSTENNDTSYLTTPINDDEWKTMIAMIVPSNALEELYIEQLEKAVKNGHRRRFTWVSKKDLLDVIGDLSGKKGAGGPKKASLPNQLQLPASFQALLDNYKQAVTDNPDVEFPDDLLFKLLKIKLLDIKSVEKDKEAARANLANKAHNPAPAKNAPAKKDKSPTGGKKSPTKPKKSAAGPLPDIEKHTQLKKKQEIEEEEKYIDDEPKDGPQHYIVLSGFYSASIFNHAEEYSLPIDCLIKFKSPNLERIKEFYAEIDERERLEAALKTNLKLSQESIGSIDKSEKQSIGESSMHREVHLNKVKLEIEKFWVEANKILEKPDDKQTVIQHIARLKYSLKNDPNVKSWFEPEPRAEFSDQMFDEISERLFYLVIQKRQYSFYINNLKLYQIPSPLPPMLQPSNQLNVQFSPSVNVPTLNQQLSIKPEDLAASGQPLSLQQSVVLNNVANIDSDKICDMRYYNELVNALPAEYISTPIILHCMIEQIIATDEKKPLPSESYVDTSVPNLQNINHDIAKHFSEMVGNLALDDKEKQKLASLLPNRSSNEKEPNKKNSPYSPVLINYNDEIGTRLKGVFDDESKRKTKSPSKLPFDPIQVETNMLSKSMWSVFTGLPYVPEKLAKERTARLQELMHFCLSPETTTADVDRAFKQFVFETMNVTGLNKKNFVKRSNRNVVIPWDDPYPNITATLSEDQQMLLKSLNLIEAAKTMTEEIKKKQSNRVSSASTTKSIKFQDGDKDSTSSSGPSSILKSRSSTKLSVQSVHFPDTFDLNKNDQISDVMPTQSIDQTIEMINNTRQRDLNDWNYAEHYEPKVLAQVLQKVSHTHPYVDSYYNRRDNSIMLIFSNPFDEMSLTNHEEWNIKLHSNVGFRNYLEKIYEMIIEWTRDEEAKYQASLIATEVDKFRTGSPDKNASLERASQGSANSKRGKSPKGSRKGSPGKQSNTSKSPTGQGKKGKEKAPVADESTEYITNSFMGHNSLKAWKIEHDKQMAEISAKEAKGKKTKSPKGSKSPRGSKSPEDKPKSPKDKKEQKGQKDKDSEKGKVRSRSSSPKGSGSPGSKPKSPNSKSKKSRSGSKGKLNDSDQKPPTPKPAVAQKANNLFIGYDVGNNMVYVKSYLNHMFPVDGSLIKTERHVLKSIPKTFITTSLIREGHTFSIHLVDPKTEESNTANSSPNKDSRPTESELKSKLLNTSTSKHSDTTAHSENRTSIAKYSCFTSVFRDGFSLSYSNQVIKPTYKEPTPLPPSPRLDQSQVSVVQEQPKVEEKEKEPKEKPSNKKNTKKGTKKDPTPEPTNLKNAKQAPIEIKKIDDSFSNKSIEIKEQKKVLPWSQLFLSVPTGLSCTFLPEAYVGVAPTEDYQPHRLVVKQYFTSKCDDRASEYVKDLKLQLFKEKSRLIMSDGKVVKFFENNNIEIYYANGTIYRKINEIVIEAEPEHVEIEPQNTKEKPSQSKLKKKDANKVDETVVHNEVKIKAKWFVITPSGTEYLVNKAEKKYELVKYYRNIEAHDSHTGESMVTREDNVRLVYRPDGSSVVEYPDGTRITIFYATIDAKDVTMDSYNEEANTPTKYARVECPGFATTIFNCKTSECSLSFGTGYFASCDPKKMAYNITTNNDDILEIDQEGVVTYLPRSRNEPETPRPKFLFYQNSDTIFDHVDEDSNIFKVNKLGKCTSLPANNNEDSKSSRSSIRRYQKHSPRFFVVHKDSSGTELLRYEDVCDYLNEIEVDPMTAIIRDNVQGFPTIMGTTVLRPLKDSLTNCWLSEYTEKDIVPFGLRCRNLLTFPPNPEIKVPGPKFGSNVGRSLQIDVNTDRKRVKNPPLAIAKRMEYRQLIEYQKLSDALKSKLILGLKNYMMYIAERAENHRHLLTHDPRTDAERLTAFKVLQVARPDHLFKSDIAQMYRNALGKKDHQNENFGRNLKLITKLLSTNHQKRNEKLHEEIKQEKANKEAWKKCFVPAYFLSEWGQAFLKYGSNNATSNKENINNNNYFQTSENDFSNNESNPMMQDKSQVQNQDTLRDDFSSQSFKGEKKTNQKPIYAFKSEDDPFKPKKDPPVVLNDRYQAKFQHQDRLGGKKVPTCIKTTRPNAEPNLEFLSNEEASRRKVNTSIIKASLLNGKSLELRRGIEVYPKEIKFGILREGFSYVVDFELFNVGIDACRFKIKQPPPESGMKILFKPGPIAAGMSRDVSIMLLAIYKYPDEAAEQVNPRIRQIRHVLEITSETDIIKLNVEAEIATAEEFRNMFRGNLEAGKSKEVRILSVRPGSTRQVLTKPIDPKMQVLDFDIQEIEDKEFVDVNY